MNQNIAAKLKLLPLTRVRIDDSCIKILGDTSSLEQAESLLRGAGFSSEGVKRKDYKDYSALAGTNKSRSSALVTATDPYSSPGGVTEIHIFNNDPEKFKFILDAVPEAKFAGKGEGKPDPARGK